MILENVSANVVSPPDDVGMREFLQQADLSDDAVLVHVVLVDLHHRHLPGCAVHYLSDREQHS